MYIQGGTLGEGAQWRWYIGSCGGSIAGTGDTIYVSPSDTTTYYVRAVGSCNTTICRDVTVNVNPLPGDAGSITGASPVCQGTNEEVYSLDSVSYATSYTWDVPSVNGFNGNGSNSDTVEIDFDPDAEAGTITVTPKNACGTGGSSSLTININEISIAPTTINSTSNTICEGESITLTIQDGYLGKGAQWKWYKDGCGTTPVGSGNLITLTPAQTTTFYARGEGDCNNTACANITITINNVPENNGPIEGENTVCQGDTSLLFYIPEYDDADSYSWIAPTGFNIVEDHGDSIIVNIQSDANTGTLKVYGENASCGIGDTLQLTINVDTLPNVYFEMPLNKYTNESEADTIEIFSPPGGVFSGSGIVNVNRTFHPTIAGLGDHRIEYTYTTPAGCTNMHFDSVEVFVPGGYIDGLENQYCNYEEQDTIEAITDEPVVGTFSGNGITDIGSNKAIFDPNAVIEGDHTVSFTYFDTATSDYITIDDYTYIDSIGNVYFIGNQINYCLGESTDELIGFPDEGGNGVFSGDGIFLSHFFNPDTAGVGVHPVTYTFTSSYGCVKDTTKEISVHGLPSVSFDMDSSYCANHEPIFINGSPVGGNFTGPNLVVYGDSVQFSPGNNIIGDNQFSYFYTDSNGCSNNHQETVKVMSVPILGISNQLKNEFCVNGNQVVIRGLLSGSNNPYGRFTGNGIIDINHNDGQAVFSPDSAGVGGPYNITYTFTDNNGCTNSVDSTTIVYSIDDVSINGVDSAYCIDNPTVTFSGFPSGSGGQFTVQGSTTPGSTFNFDPSDYSAGEVTVSYQYTNEYNCSNNINDTVTIFDLPVVSFSSDSVFCANDAPIELIGSPIGGDFQGAGINNGYSDTSALFTPSTSIVGLKNITYSYQDDSTSCSNSQIRQFEVLSLPNISISNDLKTQYCVNNPPSTIYGLYNGDTAFAGKFSGNGIIDTNITDGFAIFDPDSASVGGPYTITFTFSDSNSCENMTSKNVEVLPLPVITISDNLEDNYCVNNPAELVFGMYEGDTAFSGEFDGDGILDTNEYDGQAVFNPSAAGVGGPYNIIFIYSDYNGCVNEVTDTVGIWELPTIAISGSLASEFCVNNAPVDIFGLYNTDTAYSGVFSGNGIIDTDTTDGIAIFNPDSAGVAASHAITFTYSDSNGCVNSVDSLTEVLELPSISISYNLEGEYCVNDEETIIYGFYEGDTAFSGEFSGVGVIDPNTSDGQAIFNPDSAGVGGPYQVTFTFSDGNGCENMTSKNVEVLPLPVITISDNLEDNYCVNNPAELVFGMYEGDTAFSGEFDGDGILDTNEYDGQAVFNPSAAGVGGPYNIIFIYSDYNGCVNEVTDTVGIWELPTIAISGSLASEFCVNNAPVDIFGLYNTDTAYSGVFSGNGIIDTDTTDGIAIFNPDSAGVAASHAITFTYSDSNGCVNSVDSLTEVLELPSISISYNLEGEYCVNDEETIIYGFYEGDTAFSGEFSGVGVIDPNTSDGQAIFNPDSAGVGGPYQVTFTFSDGNGCENMTSKNVEVLPLPVITISDNLEDNYCVNNPAELVFGMYEGDTAFSGEFDGDGILDTNEYDGQAVFNPSAAGVGGPYNIIFIYSDYNGCVNEVTDTVGIWELPTIAISGSLASEFCVNNAPVDIFGLYNTDTAYSGVFSGNGIIDTDTTDGIAIFNPDSAGVAASHAITFTYSDSNGCVNSVDSLTEVLELPSISISYNLEGEYCVNDEETIIYGFYEGDTAFSGEFSGVGVIDPNTSDGQAIFNPDSAGVGGPYQVTFTFSDGNGCENMISKNVEVLPLPVITISDNLEENYCVNNSATIVFGMYEGDTAFSGEFDGNGILDTNEYDGQAVFNPASAGVGGPFLVSYLFTDENGCTNSASQNVEVLSLPAIGISEGLAGQYCVNDTSSVVYGFYEGDTAFSGFFSGNGIIDTNLTDGQAMLNPQFAGVGGPYPITFTFTDNNGCTNTIDSLTHILGLPNISISNSLEDEYCLNSPSSDVYGLYNLNPANSGNFAGQGITDSIANDGQAIFDPMNAGAGGPYSITFTFTDTNGCTNSYNQQTQVLSLPNINISSDLKNEYCVNDASSTIYGLHNGENANDGFFSGSGISDPNLNDGQASFTPSSAGVGDLYPIIFAFTDTNGCTNTDTNYTSVLSLPTISISENFQPQYCINYQPDTIYGFYNGDTAFSGDFAGNGVINADPDDGKAIFFPSAAGIGGPYSISFEFTDSNGCTNTVDSTTQVFGLPIIGISNELQDEYCINSSQNLIFGEYYGETATSGYFTGSGIIDTNQNDGQAVFNPIAAGVSPSHEITFIYTDTNNCTKSIIAETSVLGLPNINISNLDSEYCLNDNSSNLTGLYSGSPAGKGTFSGTGIVDTDPTDGLAKFYPDSAGVGGPYEIMFAYTDTNGCSNSFDSTTFVLALPDVSISSTLLNEYCLNNPSQLIQGLHNSAPANSGYFSGIGIIDTNDNDGLAVFDPAEAGAGGPYSISYTYTDTNSCSNTSGKQVIVQELPNIAISDDLQSQYCINVSTDTIFGLYNGAINNQGLFSGTGIIDNDTTDGMAIIDPGFAGVGGPYTILYTFTDTNNCTDTTYSNVEVNNIDNVSITSINEIYCSDIDEVQELQGSPAAIDPEDALWTFGSESNNGSSFSFTPLEYDAGFIEVSYQYTNDDNCTDTTWDTIFIAPIPVARFEVTDNCMENTIDFFDLSIPEDTLINPQDSITSWEWYFTSVGVPDTTIQHPSHLYTSEGNKNILLRVTNIYGCDDVLDTNIVFTGSPVADFDWNNECFGADSTYFFSLVDTTIYSIEEYIWNFGDNTTTSVENPAHQYDSVSNYNVSLVVETVNGCSDTVEQTIFIRPFVSSYPYMQNFEAGTGGWEDETDNISSWAFGEPNGININHAASGTNAWVTNLNGNYLNNESSFIEGPCFNFSNLQKPMIKFKLWHLTDIDLDGAVLQAYRNEDEGWFRVGSLDEGVNWYNSFSIVGSPGNQSQGWSGNSGTEWIDARHDLDMLAGEPYVRFRVAFGSDANSTQEGVAFDDIWVGERNRFVLVEHFTNNSDVESATITPDLNDYIDENSLYAIDIRHHVYYPGEDVFYYKYPAGPSARNFFYSFFDVPFTILDGNVFKGNTTELLNNEKDILNIRSLKEALFQVRMNQSINNTEIDINIELEPYNDIPQKEVALFLALIEKQAIDESSSMAGTYRNVLRNMLPDPGGSYFNKEWSAGEVETLNLSGSLKNFDDINQLRIVAFIQDIFTKEIYQSSKLDLDETVSFSKDSTENDNAGKLNFHFYPLPANENVNIAMNKAIGKNLNVEVYNSFGQMKYKKIIPANTLIYKLNTEELVNGIYYIKIYENNKLLKSKKVLVFH